MKYLFIDTETTGLAKDESLSPMVIDNWPRLVSFAYILCDERDIVDRGFFIIKPNKFIIPIESTKIHGITTADAVSKGIVLSEVLDIIRPLIEKCDYIVGHNVGFDVNVLNAEFYRYNMTLPVSLKPYYCTMMLSKDYCGLPNNKYPTLDELYTILKGESFSNAHNAMTDAQASMECFWILKDTGILKSKTEKPIIKIYPTKDNILWAAEHISIDYAAKVYAYLTIVCNLLYNNSNFLKSKKDLNLKSIVSKIDQDSNDENFVEDYLDALYPQYICAKNPKINSDWINSMFNFLKEEIQKTSASVSFNKYDGSRSVVVRSYLRYYLKDIEKEIGVKELIEKFKIKYPESPYESLLLEDESCWVDIAIEAVKTRIQSTDGIENEQLSQADAESYFISMIEYFNKFRETERDKTMNEWNKGLEESLNPKNHEKSLEEIKNYSSPYTSSSSGCMLILSIIMGVCSAFCCLIITLL